MSKPFAPTEIQIDTAKQFGVAIYKLKSNEALNSQDSLKTVSEMLESIMPEKVNAVMISNVSSEDTNQQFWGETLYLKQG